MFCKGCLICCLCLFFCIFSGLRSCPFLSVMADACIFISGLDSVVHFDLYWSVVVKFVSFYFTCFVVSCPISSSHTLHYQLLYGPVLLLYFGAPRSTDGMLIVAVVLFYFSYFRASLFLTSNCFIPTGFQHSLCNHSMKSWIYVFFSISLRAGSLVRYGVRSQSCSLTQGVSIFLSFSKVLLIFIVRQMSSLFCIFRNLYC